MIVPWPRTPRPEIAYDDEHEVITINGLRYSYAVFEGLAFLPVGAVIKLLERRSDGTLVVSRLYDLEENIDDAPAT